jgi:hypothetical protein
VQSAHHTGTTNALSIGVIRTILILLISLAFLQAVPCLAQRGRPGSGASIDTITRTINDCEERTDRFVRALRRALNSSVLDGTNREDQLNRAARNLEESMDRVGRSWNRDKDVAKTRRWVREAIDNAKNIDVTMRNRRLHPEAEEQWRAVRFQVNLLARAFKLPTVNW